MWSRRSHYKIQQPQEATDCSTNTNEAVSFVARRIAACCSKCSLSCTRRRNSWVPASSVPYSLWIFALKACTSCWNAWSFANDLLPVRLINFEESSCWALGRWEGLFSRQLETNRFSRLLHPCFSSASTLSPRHGAGSFTIKFIKSWLAVSSRTKRDRPMCHSHLTHKSQGIHVHHSLPLF